MAKIVLALSCLSTHKTQKIVLDKPRNGSGWPSLRKTDFSAYQEQFLGLFTKQKNVFLNNETNSFLGTLSVCNNVFCARKN